jgi:Carboxypeptidase regulatory-like domain/TonB dependent receptor
MSFSKLSIRTFMFMICVLLGSAAARAQYRASIQGVVTDSAGAAVSGATVTLHNEETGQDITATTNSEGVYNFNSLPPSRFTVTVEATGFKKKVVQGVGLISEQANSLNVALDVGQVSESVTVNGDAAPLIDTETANLSGTVTAQEFQKLPSFGRDPFQLLQLAPGAFGDGAQGAGGGTQNLPSTTIGGTGGTDGVFKIENGGQISANGARTGENNYQIDGVGTTSVTWGGTSVITPNEDSIKEVKIVTDNYDAENGRYRGAQVQVISQNGTNQYHGSAYFKIHRPGLDAFTKYNGYNGSNVRDSSRFNDWGGSAGGPIVKNHLFVFFSYETLSDNARQGTGGNFYETPQYRALSGAPNASQFLNFAGVAPNGGTFAEKTCADAGLIDAAHVSASQPVANCAQISGQGLDIGSPLTAGVGSVDHAYSTCYQMVAGACTQVDYGTGGDGLGGTNNLDGVPDIAFFSTVQPVKSSHRQYNGRVDFNATSKDLVAFSMYYVPNSSSGINGNGDRLMNLFNSEYTNRAATVLWDHTFSPTLVNEARINAAGWINKDLASNPNGPFGLPQVSYNAIGSLSGDTAVRGFGIGSFNGFDQWTYAVKDVLTKIHGAHTMKMGGEFTRLLSVDAPFWADRPSYTFNNIWDFLNDAPVSENAQSDPQTGVPSALRKDLKSNVIGLFFQDNYKVKSNLTITAGLRWEYFGPISAKNGKLATVDLGSGDNVFTDIRVRTGGSLYNASKHNFGPQLGFAWSPKGIIGHDFSNRLVFRGGIGVAFNGLVQSNSLDGRFNPPFVDNSPSFPCPNGPADASTCQLLYANSFPADPTNPNGYAANPNALVTFDSNNLPVAGSAPISLTAYPRNEPTTYTYHYTLGADYELPHRWVASVGYQGSNTRHLTEHYNLYDVGAAQGLAFNPAVNGVTYYANDGNSNFNALLLELKHEFASSFLLDTQYRYSHSIDSGSNAYAGGFYQYNLATGYATSDYDTRHAFKLYGIWSPRIFRGDHSWAEKIVGGWSISGILNAHTGFPWTPVYNLGDLDGGFDPVFNFGKNSAGSSNNAGNSQILPAAYLGGFKPDYRSSATTASGGTALFTPPDVSGGVLFACLFPNPDPTACPTGQQPLGPIPTVPGIHRNIFTGPGYFDVDATLSKSFGLPTFKVIGENAKIEFRANFYNLFNKLNLFNPQNNIFDQHFGEAQNALGSRTIELQARFSF